MLLDPVLAASDDEALRFGDTALTYRELRGAAGAVAARVAGLERVAMWATPTIETAVGVVGCVLAGVAVVPVNPKAGTRELEHIVSDSDPRLVLHDPGAELPGPLAEREGHAVDVAARGDGELPGDLDPERPALVIYTSGTTGPPKGVLLPRRSVESNLEALAKAWQWTGGDRLVQGLPLFHVHGLVLGILGPLQRGGSVEHLGRFSTQALAAGVRRGATMVFGVPTMYHRIAQDGREDPSIGEALRGLRLLVSGSAALPGALHTQIEELCGQRIVERYGMSETLMNTSVRADGDRRPGYVGLPLDGVEIRLFDDDGDVIESSDDETIGEIAVRGPNLFLEYLNRPDATAEVLVDGWFHTGDLATRAPDGYIRIVGRRATDLIKSGGYKIGAGEIETALLEHPGVAEAAVTGEEDADLGERIVAWIVRAPGAEPESRELSDHVASLLAVHKRPRDVRFVESLPRNEMGKVQKRALRAGG